MRAGIAAGRALVSSLHRIAHKPQLLNAHLSSSNLLPKSSSSSSSSSITPVLWKEYHGMELGSSSSLWSQSCTAPFAMSHVTVDGHRRSRFDVSVVFRGLATQTATKTLPTRTPVDSKVSSETDASSANRPSPPTGVGSSSEKPNTEKSGIVKQMLLDFGAVPFPALVLGIAGLIPFVALAPPLAQMLPLPGIVAAAHADAQAAYAASIVSFLGAIHWGLAMADYAAPGKGGVANMTLMTSRYVWSVVPSLMAWTALLLPPTTKFALLIFSLWMVLGVEDLSSQD